MPETFFVWVQGEQYGPFSLPKLYEMRLEGRLLQSTLYWSEHYKEWRGIVSIMQDHYPSADRLRQIRESGITHCKILGPGDGTECPACASLVDRIMHKDEVPVLPPAECQCTPWFRCVVVAASAA